MTRPTKEQVEHALRLNDAGVIFMPTQDVPELLVVDILAAEVRALREELQEYMERCDGYGSVCAEHEATIARVEALLAKWRAKANRPQSPLFTNAEHALTTFTYGGCADDIEAALKGGE